MDIPLTCYESRTRDPLIVELTCLLCWRIKLTRDLLAEIVNATVQKGTQTIFAGRRPFGNGLRLLY